jgi:hypothetical protein
MIEAQQVVSPLAAMKQALEAWQTHVYGSDIHHKAMLVAMTNMGQAIAEAEKQEPVAWLITDEKINSLQVDSIQRLVDRARHAHMTDIKLRINGQDEWHQADWLKHLTRTTPPQRTWVGLTDEEIAQGWKESWVTEQAWQSAVWWAEEKLKEKNT